MKTLTAFAAAAAFAAISPLAIAGVDCKASTPAHEHNHGANCGAQGADTQSAVYKATGSVKNVNRATGKVTIAHGPVAELKWPAMTMQFAVADKKLLGELAAGKTVDFRFVQRGSDYVVTALY